ncbi:DNA gyrase subunit B [Izhakiella australiensis]|uniref:DNA gyrase subunit B n=1 Tax=Izhakiella australiensis TaxID=1926881 RepID=A0A1S8YNW4_9GAMM|nr:hypothetical protein [Izhakiella australiensis]OON40744.1 DNA gyrase subunit B [Izhakiella australiensis]
MRFLGWLAVICWPLLVWLSLTHPQWRGLIPLLMLVFILRVIALRNGKTALAAGGRWLAAAGILLTAASLLLQRTHLLLWYPVAVNVILLLLFAASLRSAMPLVERLARLQEPELSAAGVRYTRRVTQVWCVFFLFNGTIALITCVEGNLNHWIIWNGGLSYGCIAVMMVTEWFIRRRVRAAK